MFQVGCRLRNIGLLWVLVLTCSNVLLTVKLLSYSADCGSGPGHGGGGKGRGALQPLQQRQPARKAEPLDPPDQQPPEDDFDQQPPNVEEDPDTISVDPALGRWDSRRVLKMFDLALVGGQFGQLSAEYKVTLATQTSLERLHSLVQVVHHWTGPVSVALYAAGDEWPLVQAYVRYLRRCYAPVRERVAFHAAFPADRMPESSPDLMMEILGSEAHLDCFKPEPSLKEVMRQRHPETIRWRMRHGYPQNHLRNLARKASQVRAVMPPLQALATNRNVYGVRVPGRRGRGAEPGPGAGPQRVPADGSLRAARRPRGAAAPPGAADGPGRPAAPLRALRLRHPHVRAGRPGALPAQQERPGAARGQGAGPALPPQGVHLQPVCDQLQPVAEREGRRHGPRPRRLQRHQLRVPVRAVLRGQGHDAGARRALHGLRLHEEHAGVRDVRDGGAVPSAVPGLHGALGPAEQAGTAGVAGAAEQREPAPLRHVQEGGGGSVQAGPVEYGPAEACTWQSLEPRVREEVEEAYIRVRSMGVR